MDNFEIDDALSANSVQATHKVAIATDDDGNPTVGFVIVGKDSPQYRNCLAAQRSRAIKRQANKKMRIDAKTEAGAEELDSVIQRNQSELTLAVVVDWFGFTHQGQPRPFDPSVLAQIFAARPSWKDKCAEALEVEENFLKGSTTPSLNSSSGSSS